MISAGETLARHFRLLGVPQGLHPRYNVAPTQNAPIVRADQQGALQLVLLRWGLVPHWAHDMSIGARMINARSESVQFRPAFREAFRHRRCLVPASGFYEWQEQPGGKQPFYIRSREQAPLAFAGLWESWRDVHGDVHGTFTILTTEAPAALRPIHPRMPLLLEPADYAEWTGSGAWTRDLPCAATRPASVTALEAIPVARWVNSPQNDDVRCIEPTGPPLSWPS